VYKTVKCVMAGHSVQRATVVLLLNGRFGDLLQWSEQQRRNGNNFLSAFLI